MSSQEEKDEETRRMEYAKRTTDVFARTFASLGSALAMYWAINLVRSRWGIEPVPDMLWAWFMVMLLPFVCLAIQRGPKVSRFLQACHTGSVVITSTCAFAAMMGFPVLHVILHGMDHNLCLSDIEKWREMHPDLEGSVENVSCSGRDCRPVEDDGSERTVTVKFDAVPWYEPRYQPPEDECRQTMVRMLAGDPVPKAGDRVAVKREACDALHARPTSAMMRPIR